MEAFLLRRFANGERSDARGVERSAWSAYSWLGFAGEGEATLLFQSESNESLEKLESATLGSSCTSRTALPAGKPGYGGLQLEKRKIATINLHRYLLLDYVGRNESELYWRNGLK